MKVIRSTSTGMLIIFALVVLSLVGCTSDKGKLPWSTDAYGRFYTFDLERAQKEIPFQIIVPNHLPPNLGNHPHIVGPLRGTEPGSEIQVELEYLAADEGRKGIISIVECNFPCEQPAPELNPVFKYVEIAESTVIEGTHMLTNTLPNGSVNHPGFTFGWNKDGVYFIAAIYGYDRNEAVKVVESMIEQGKNTSSTPSPSQ